MTREPALREGTFGGFFAGANLVAAVRLLQRELAGGSVVLVIPDTGLKYLSTDLWPEGSGAHATPVSPSPHPIRATERHES